MNFFEHQDAARKSTRLLVLFFSLAVFSIVVITNVVLIIALWFFDASIVSNESQQQVQINQNWDQTDFLNFLFNYLDLHVVAWVSLLVVGVIGFVILFNRSELSGGGKVVAERLGGKKISLDTTEFHERVILNVVEEMSIASGIAVPPVYLLPEKSINAFAAGFETGDAVIGISQGAIENLNRDELQGVVAHEFSHIFNGDMRLNINLIAVLSGILFIGHIGWFFVRGSGNTRRHRNSGRDVGGGIALLGLALVILGAVGTFFGNLIKAAVSRQREFLADASAVQFTRNPEGIAGALKKIGGSIYGSRLLASHAKEMSHLFFGDAIKHLDIGFSSLMATHPPLEERIRRIEPRWNGKFIRISPEQAKDNSAKQQENISSFAGDLPVSQQSISQTGIQNLASTIENVGQPDIASYQQAGSYLQGLSEILRTSLHETQAAKAFIYLLLLNPENKFRKQQLEHLEKNENTEVNQYIRSLESSVLASPKAERINLVELSIPALKEMTREEYDQFVTHVVALVKADNEINLFEWLLHSMLIHYLKSSFYKVKVKHAKYRNLSKLRNECRILLSYVTYAGEPNNEKAYQKIFNQGFEILDLGSTVIVPREELALSELNKAMFHFSHLFPLVKPRLLKACALSIQADGDVGSEQYELLRAIAALLDCPMPLINLEGAA